MVQIDAGIDGLKGTVGGIALLIAANDVVAHAEGDNLFIVEDILDDDDGTAPLFVGMLVGILVLLTLTEFAHTDTDAELLAAVWTLEDQ